MVRSENPFRPAFWIGAVDPRPLALFRIALGLTILHDLVDYTRDLRAFLTDDGMLPRGTIHDAGTWGLFDLVGSPLAVGVLFALGFVVVAAFTAGFMTRAATIASWVFLASLHHRNYYAIDGGDDFVRILMFWSIFGELGAAYGVDAYRRATRVVDVPAFGLRLLQLQIAVMYFAAARLKYRLGWLHGDNIFYTLQLVGFTRPPGEWLEGSPALCRLLTKATLAMEWLFAFAAFSPVAVRASRATAIACGLLVQLGIFVTMRVGIFTETMLGAMTLFLLPEWIDRAEAWLRRRRGRPDDARPTSVVACPPWRHAVHAAVFAEFVIAIWGVVAARRFPMPRPVYAQMQWLDLEAKYGLFDVTYATPHWEAPGVLGDGTAVEVLAVVAPGAMPKAPAFRFSRWNKLTFKEREHPFRFPELAAYFCRKYDEETAASSPGSKLASFTLVNHETPPRPPSGPADPPTDRTLWVERCP
jgi:hypothetical protein